MGYACPVCTDPQADSGHLANHLAFTAILGGNEHEAWLDEHVSEWDEMGEDELASVLAESLETSDFPQLFEDTAGGLESKADPPAERSGTLFNGQGYEEGQTADPDRSGASAPKDEETERILKEAKAMTRQMMDDESAE